MISTSSILIVDRSESTHTLLEACLGEDYTCVPVRNAKEALKRLQEGTFDLVIADIRMMGAGGIELCKFIHDTYPDTVVVGVSEVGGVQYAIEAMRQGAVEYIEKPLDSAEVCISVKHALRQRTLSNRAGLQALSIGLSGREAQQSPGR